MNTHYTHVYYLAPLCLVFSIHSLFAQDAEVSGLSISEGTIVSIGKDAIVSVGEGDVYVAEGATLVNHGELLVGRDLFVDGTLQTLIGGSEENPTHGRIYVSGEAEYRGTLSVALARGAHFTKPQDFVIANYTTGFGVLAAKQLPGASWSSAHLDHELVVRLDGTNGTQEEGFDLQLDATLLEEEVLVDWVAHNDLRSEKYIVERFDQAFGWQAIGTVNRIAAETSTAYYSTVDANYPASAQVLRYRLRLEDQQGDWHFSNEVLVTVDQGLQLGVFPNPVLGSDVRVVGLDEARGIANLRLFDQTGRQVREFTAQEAATGVLALPSNLAGGTYSLQVSYQDQHQQATQVVVVRR